MSFHCDSQTRQMLTGNLLLIVCCIFYLLWWLVAFKPTGAIKGMKSGWLLIPAFLFGAAAVIWIARGSAAAKVHAALLPRSTILIGGIVAYVLLLAATYLLLKRPVTTELFLIVGWVVLLLLELNALYGLGYCSKSIAVVFLIVILTAAIISLICYLLYYGLDSKLSYIDGAVPLLLVSVVTAAISACIIVR